MPTTTQRTSPSQPARVRISAGYRKFPSGCQGRCDVHSTAQRVDERRFEVLELLRRPIRRGAAEEALHEDAVQRADDEPGVELGPDRGPDRALLTAALHDVGQQVAVHPLELAEMGDEVVRMLLLAQHEPEE